MKSEQQPAIPAANGLHDVGWATTPAIVESSALDELLAAIQPVADAHGDRGGVRNLLDLPAVRELARSPAVRAIANGALGAGAFAVRGILFDKTPEANWKVIWHQDLTIAVQARVDADGFGPWSEKAGVPHVQPPSSVLERMVAVRVHLDACGDGNGPVRVLPGSHRVGRLGPAAIDQWRATAPPVDCHVERGVQVHPNSRSS
jgi:ectoine hydroxylase-related dioxygenase (phytanoyl-CoA dioxygenase family)